MNSDPIVVFVVVLLYAITFWKINQKLNKILKDLEEMQTDVQQLTITTNSAVWMDQVLNDTPRVDDSIIDWLNPNDVRIWEEKEQQLRELQVYAPVFGKHST
jgi:hypothetical protein